jgi:hypothetical protein
MHAVCAAFFLALDNAVNSSAARIAMMAITTSSSIKVKARREFMNEIKPPSRPERKGEIHQSRMKNHGGKPMASFTAEYSG